MAKKRLVLDGNGEHTLKRCERSNRSPFTVFAPTDEAFVKLPAGTVEDLLEPENKEKLVAILTYHVVPGKPRPRSPPPPMTALPFEKTPGRLDINA